MGSLQLSGVISGSVWVDAYFEETALSRIHEGDAATIKLMGYSPLLRGRVQGLSRGINVPNAAPDALGLASVNPIFTFVRLAQRVPVRIHIDEVPEGVKLVAGMTATVQIEPFKAEPVSDLKPASGTVGQADVQPASFQTLADAPPQTGAPQAGPLATTTRAPSGQPGSQLATQAAQQQPAAAAASPTTQQKDASQSAASAPAPASNELSVAIPPSPQAAAAADAAAADLKTLQQQIAANPPGGAGSAKSDGGMPSSEFLGQTYDLYGNQTATPTPRPRSPETIRRRARSRWRHLPPRSPSP